MAGKKNVNLDMIPNIITIGLYGGKSFFKGVRDTKYRAEVVSCDCEHCSFRDKGMCLKVTSVVSHLCKYGQKHIFEGYTPAAASCTEWKHNFTSHEKYGKLKSVSSGIHFGVVGDYYFIYTQYVGVKREKDGTLKKDANAPFIADKVFDEEKKEWIYKGYTFETSTYSDARVFIEKDDADIEFLKDLLSYKPYALFGGGEIKDYRLQIVSLILKQMRELAPELHEKLTAAYPAFKAYAPNFIGKYVYVRTMKPDIDIYVEHHGVFHLSADRKTLVCKEYRGVFLPFGAKQAEMVIPVTDDMKFKVTDNEQCCDDTEIAS